MSTTESWPRRLVDTAGSPERRSARERRTEELLRAEGPALDPHTREAVYRAAAHAALSDDRMPLWPPLAAAAAVLLAFAATVWWTRAGDDVGPMARVAAISGTAEVRGRDGWTAVDDARAVQLPARVRVAAESTASVALARGADVRLEPGTDLWVHEGGVTLARGAAVHRVAPGRGAYDVELGAYRAVVLGTRFWTARDEHGASVCVMEGVVEVRRREETLATLRAGEGWRSGASAPPFRSSLPCAPRPVARAGAAEDPPPAPPRAAHAAPSPPAEATAPARRARPSAPREAPPASATETASRCDDQPDPESCLRALADRDGLVAEVALYRLGRRRARAGDHSAALDAWLEHSRRFPRGVLAEEVHLAILDAQLATGSPEALATADRFLTAHPASTQRGEVHAVGATLRHRAGDCAGALAQYDAAIAATLAARRREEALYGRASCLDTLRRRDEAAAAYRLYLEAHPEGRFAARARARVERDVVPP